MAKKDPWADARKRGEEMLKANPELAKKLENIRAVKNNGDLAVMLHQLVDFCMEEEAEISMKTYKGMITEITLKPRIELMGG